MEKINNIIQVRNLGFDYGEGWVFHKLDLEIAQGDFVAVIGANGAGKSTLLKMLAHVMPPTAGEIDYYGQPISVSRIGIKSVMYRKILLRCNGHSPLV